MQVICERALNFEKIVFYLLVLLLPTQFGKHFWPAFSQVLGIRIDYLSPTLYTTDLLIFALFFLWLKRQKKLSLRGERTPGSRLLDRRETTKQSLSIMGLPRSFQSLAMTRKEQGKFLNSQFSILIFFAFLLLNIFLSNNPLLGLYGLAKILEFFFLGYYVSQNLKTKKEVAITAAIFSITVIGESLLAIAQYIHQGSLNGFLYFLGERKFTSITPGIANASIIGELILRPYGTFPHPNVLAGFLLCSLIFIFAWFEDKKDIKKKLLKTVALLLGSLALFLTLSRVAITLWFFIAIVIAFRLFFSRHSHPVIARPRSGEAISYSTRLPRRSFLAPRNDKNGIKDFLPLLIIIVSFILLFFTPVLPRLEGTNFTEEAFSQRADLFKSTLIMIKDHPLLGVGLLNFLPGISFIQKPLSPTLYLQPVHNIFLLITAEIGIIGLAFFLLFLFKTYKRLLFYLSLRERRTKSELACLTGVWTKQSPAVLLILLSVILILGLFDHYWLTIQQGQLLFTLILGLCWAL